jgi:hypothetical protein
MAEGLILYILGNALVLVQNWIGKLPKSRTHIQNSRYQGVIFSFLMLLLVVGALTTLYGLYLIFKVHWWLALLLLVIGEPFFAKRMLD